MNGPFVAITKRTRLSFILSFRFFDVFGVLEAHEIFDPWENKTQKEHGTKQNKNKREIAPTSIQGHVCWQAHRLVPILPHHRKTTTAACANSMEIKRSL